MEYRYNFAERDKETSRKLYRWCRLIDQLAVRLARHHEDCVQAKKSASGVIATSNVCGAEVTSSGRAYQECVRGRRPSRPAVLIKKGRMPCRWFLPSHLAKTKHADREDERPNSKASTKCVSLILSDGLCLS